MKSLKDLPANQPVTNDLAWESAVYPNLLCHVAQAQGSLSSLFLLSIDCDFFVYLVSHNQPSCDRAVPAKNKTSNLTPFPTFQKKASPKTKAKGHFLPVDN